MRPSHQTVAPGRRESGSQLTSSRAVHPGRVLRTRHRSAVVSTRPLRRPVLSVLLAGVLAALLVGLLTGNRLVDLDEAVYRWAPERHWPQLSGLLDWWVVLGQRAVCLSLAAGWLGLRAWRTRDVRPLGVLLVATLLTQAGVGAMKNLVGRLGPLQLGSDAVLPGGSDLFAAGGTIFPSGHTANAVVTWGVLALVAREHRRLGAVLAAGVALSVGLTTVYLGTHWISDVVAGWCAGGLVLLALPTAVSVAAWAADRVRIQVAALGARRQQRSDRRQHGRARPPLGTAASR
jgi:membrane-associated phospholipid phosphatase